MRSWHSLVGLLCVLVAVGVARTQESNPAPPDDPPGLAIEIRPTDIEITGIVSSVGHEAILKQTILTLFPGKSARYELRTRAALPPGWALITDLVLRALADTRSATAEVSDTEITVRGITSSRTSWEEAAARIEGHLLPGMVFHHQVQEVGSPGSMNRQCLALFRTALLRRKVEFPRESAELRTSAYPLLDRLIQIAADCPAANISITGHTDSTGDEAVNQHLSTARAEAVAAYLSRGGIASQRIVAAGVGSLEPLADEQSAQARQLNRRIEIEISFP